MNACQSFCGGVDGHAELVRLPMARVPGDLGECNQSVSSPTRNIGIWDIGSPLASGARL
jgi:hypothetical protein